MRLRKLTCPGCGASLELKISNETSSVFCQYCGQHFSIDDGKREYTINKNVNINKNIHTRYTDDAEVIRAKNETPDIKVFLIFIAIMIGLMFFITDGFGLFSAMKANKAEEEGKISAGYHDDYEDEDYKAVVEQFEIMGFTNIETVDLNDAGIRIWKNGKVESVSVDGDTSFNSDDYFYPTDTVIITYH